MENINNNSSIEEIRKIKQRQYNQKYREKLRLHGVKRLSDLKKQSDEDTEKTETFELNRYRQCDCCSSDSETDSEIRFVGGDFTVVRFKEDTNRTSIRMHNSGNTRCYKGEGDGAIDLYDNFSRKLLESY